MVSFICDACGQTIKKNRVEKHYQSECRSCSVLSCIDCGKDFHGDSYAEHTTCITEAEKYQGKLYKPKGKANKGEVKQQEWIKQVQQASEGIKNPKIKEYLQRIQEYSNVPRKKTKFFNFCNNSLRVNNPTILEELWEAFSPKKTEEKTDSNVCISNGTNSNELKLESKENGKIVKNISKEKKRGKRKRACENGIVNGENDASESHKVVSNEEEAPKKKKKKKDKKTDTEDVKNENIETVINGKEAELDDNDNPTTGKFNWQKAIKIALKDVGDDGISTKKLKKKVIAAYLEHGSNHKAANEEECSALFKKKLNGYKKAKLSKDRVFYKK